MQQIPGYDGTLMNVDMGRPVVLVPSMTMKIAFDKLPNEGLVARQGPVLLLLKTRACRRCGSSIDA